MKNKIYISSPALKRRVKQLDRNVEAYAVISGSAKYPNIQGVVLFSSEGQGAWVDVEVNGLPEYVPAMGDKSPIGPFGFHIHDGSRCEPVISETPFSGAMEHFNPNNQPHGNHAGDFPVLFSNAGYSNMSFYTNKFTPSQIIGKTVLIHLNPDDYRTQPAGNSGERIACGVIERA